jgi:hypothetical protein
MLLHHSVFVPVECAIVLIELALLVNTDTVGLKDGLKLYDKFFDLILSHNLVVCGN